MGDKNSAKFTFVDLDEKKKMNSQSDNFPFLITDPSNVRWEDKTDIPGRGWADATISLGRPAIMAPGFANIGDVANGCDMNWGSCPLSQKIIQIKDDPKYAVPPNDQGNSINNEDGTQQHFRILAPACPYGYQAIGHNYQLYDSWGSWPSLMKNPNYRCLSKDFIGFLPQSTSPDRYIWNDSGTDGDDWDIWGNSPTYHTFGAKGGHYDPKWGTWYPITHKKVIDCCSGKDTTNCGDYLNNDPKNPNFTKCDIPMKEYCEWVMDTDNGDGICDPTNPSTCSDQQKICSCFQAAKAGMVAPSCFNNMCIKSGYQNQQMYNTNKGGQCNNYCMRASNNSMSNYNAIPGTLYSIFYDPTLFNKSCPNAQLGMYAPPSSTSPSSSPSISPSASPYTSPSTVTTKPNITTPAITMQQPTPSPTNNTVYVVGGVSLASCSCLCLLIIIFIFMNMNNK